MVTINSSSLFHFTSKKDTLKKIISTGLRYSFCFESIDGNKGMALPMICFCDIPIMRSPKHRLKYGNYAIGFNKEELIYRFHNLNPVHYVTSIKLYLHQSKYRSLIIQSLEESAKDEFEKAIANCKIPYEELFEQIETKGLGVFGEDIHYKLESYIIAKFLYKDQLAYLKEYRNKSEVKDSNYYEENEWRMVPSYNSYNEKKLSWVEEVSSEEFNSRKIEFLEMVNKAENGYIKLPANDINKVISFIIVKKENMVASLIKHILQSKTLFGTEGVSYDDRLLLVSKITSFERIENDY